MNKIQRHWFIPDLRNKNGTTETKFYEYCLICRHHISSNIHFTTNEQNVQKEQSGESLSGQGQTQGSTKV